MKIDQSRALKKNVEEDGMEPPFFLNRRGASSFFFLSVTHGAVEGGKNIVIE